MIQIILLSHVFFGVACLLAATGIFVEVLNASTFNHSRIKNLSRLAAAAMWLSFLAGGYWYVVYYPGDKQLILHGPWPFAHRLIMETKEHLVILLLMLATYLPIAAAGNLVASRDARRVVLWVAGLMVLLALTMEGEGATIALGVKMGLLAR